MDILLIGNKKLENLNIDEILDKFENNYRFNMCLSNMNNGTKCDKLLLNGHVYSYTQTKKLQYIKEKYCKTYNIDEKYIEACYNELKKYNKIECQSYNWRKFNIFLKKIKCPYFFTKLPRIGHIKTMELIMNKKKPILFGFSVVNTYTDKHICKNKIVKKCLS